MKKLKNIISEELKKQLIREYSNDALGNRLEMVVSELEQIVGEIDSDVNNRLKNGDITVSKRDIIICSLKDYTKNLRKLSNIINRHSKK